MLRSRLQDAPSGGRETGAEQPAQAFAGAKRSGSQGGTPSLPSSRAERIMSPTIFTSPTTVVATPEVRWICTQESGWSAGERRGQWWGLRKVA